MSDILQIFTGNPLTTNIGKKIDAATRPDLDSDDWALNLEICDMINEHDDDARDAARAIKKRLQQIEQDKEFIVTNRTLTVLETCVSNCSKRFHVLVMTKDFIQDLVKLIGPKNNPPVDLQERVLRLIERWAEAFRNQSDLGGVVAVYNDLKAKGVTFPAPNPNSNVPIQTPQRSVAPQHSSPPSARSNLRARSPNNPPSQQTQGQISQPVAPIVLEGEGYNKISQDLTVVQTSVDMFNDVMVVLEAKGATESDWKLAADLNVTCRQMKDRIVDLIERVANEDLTIELLRLNDDLNNIFIKYDRLVKNRSKLTNQLERSTDTFANPLTTSTRATSSSVRPPEPESQENELSLIDLNAEDSVVPEKNEQQAAPTIHDPFDSSEVTAALAKSQSSQNKSTSHQVDPLAEGLDSLIINNNTKSTNKNNKTTTRLPDEISSVREQDFAEIENWLKTDSGRSELTSITDDLSSVEPVSDSKFEDFLANRALAGSSSGQSSSKSAQRQEPSV